MIKIPASSASPFVANNIASGKECDFQARAVDTFGDKDATPAKFSCTVLRNRKCIYSFFVVSIPMQKQISFVIAAAILLTAFVTAALYTVSVANAQAPAGVGTAKNAPTAATTATMNATGAAGPKANATK